MVTLSDKSKEKKQDEKGIWKAYFRLMFKAKLPWVWMILVIAIWLVGAQVTLMFPGYASKVMMGETSPKVIYGLVAVIVGGNIISGITRYFNGLLNFKIDVSYRSLIWSRLMKTPMSLYDSIKPSGMISRITTDAATISNVIGTWLPSTLATLYMTVGVIAVVFSYNWRLGVSVLIYIPFYIIFNVYYGKWSYRANKLTFNRLSTLTQFLSELLMSIPLIKTFVNESKEDLRGQQTLQYYYKANLRKSLVAWVENPISQVLGLLQTVIVISYGGYLVSTGYISKNDWVSFFLYIGMLSGTISVYFMVYIELKNSQGATTRIAELMDNELEDFDEPLQIKHLNDDISFENVSFSYGEKSVFSNVSFTILKGKVNAIIGPSGGGKSTIFSLLQQFYTPQAGAILVGDTPIDKINLKDWRSLFSVVDQDSLLISGTIRENILYGLEREVRDEELEEAARQANALKFIQEFELGFDNSVGEAGSNLSGGQRQRVAIARAILRNSEILLLDEATASLDSQAEKLVQDAMKTLMEGRTTVVISHDLSNIHDADQIIMLNLGEVHGKGTHEELMSTNELYRQFVQLH